MQIADFEIEDHVAERNSYFKKTGFTLDDLHEYSEPFAKVHRAIMDAAEKRITGEQAIVITWKAIEEIEALHVSMELENAA
jgi:hypothetical protein